MSWHLKGASGAAQVPIGDMLQGLGHPLRLVDSAGAASSAEFNIRDYGAIGDGLTDDTNAIKAAISAANSAGGGVVLLPKGIYLVSAVLLIGDNVTVEGQGSDISILRAATTITGDDGAFGVIGAKGKKNCVFTRFGVDLQTNNSANNGIALWPTVTTGDAMSGPPCENASIINCHVWVYNKGTPGPTGYAIWNRRAIGTRILYNKIDGGVTTYDPDSSQEGIEVFGGQDVLIFGNIVRGVGNGGIFITTNNDAIDVGNKNITIAFNQVSGCRRGILAQLTAYSVAQGLQIGDTISVSQNQTEDCWEAGIYMDSTAIPPNANDVCAKNIRIIGNYCTYDNSITGAAQVVGIDFTKEIGNGIVQACTIENNTIEGGRSGTSKGLLYVQRMDGALVKGNVIHGDSQSGTDSYYLAYIAKCNDFQFTDNTAHDSARGTMIFNDCARYRVANNYCFNTDLLNVGFAAMVLLNVHTLGVFQGNMFDQNVNTLCIRGSGNAADKTYLKFVDLHTIANVAFTPIDSIDLATANFGTATIADTQSSVVVANTLITQNTNGQGSEISVFQVSGTPTPFTVNQVDNSFTITRQGTAGAADYRYLIR